MLPTCSRKDSATSSDFVGSRSRRRSPKKWRPTLAEIKRILVTGGAGFIGSHLVEALVAQDFEVTVLDDLSNGFEANLSSVAHVSELIVGSIENAELVSRVARGQDAIFHLAAISNIGEAMDSPARAHAVNATGTLNVLNAARENRSQIIFASSAAVYGDSSDQPIRESSPVAPISIYGSQKLLGENYLRNFCRMYSLTGVSLRYFNVFGPRQWPDSPYSGVISRFVMRAQSGQAAEIYGDGGQSRDFVPVEYVIRANLAALRRRDLAGVAINVCTGKSITVKELARRINQLSGSTLEPLSLPVREGDIYLSKGDPSLSGELLGLTPPADPLESLAAVIRPTEPAVDL